jgi:DNA-binding response OmpR family regulator
LLNSDNKITILVVEDNLDVLKYIRGLLENDYRILEAFNGKEGKDSSIKYMPDLIISDIMMPVMDGFQLCKELRADKRISHIPVILLTALATNKDKIDGYEFGADDYIMKPFDANVLIARVRNLIKQREKLREHFRNQWLIDIEKKSISSMDKNFLKRINEVICNNLANSQFGVEAFASEFGLSRITLHKKLLALVGESPGELIRRIRLNCAADLIKNSNHNISEIALEVGYKNPSHFSEAFKNQFGTSPIQYRRNFSE